MRRTGLLLLALCALGAAVPVAEVRREAQRALHEVSSDFHHDATNPVAMQDAWADCTDPDEHGNYFSKCQAVGSEDDAKFRIAFVGSSLTAGVGVDSKAATFPSILQSLLGEHVSVGDLG